jgi:hypothetical protein
VLFQGSDGNFSGTTFGGGINCGGRGRSEAQGARSHYVKRADWKYDEAHGALQTLVTPITLR